MANQLSGAPVAYIYVADRARALAFYQGALGLTLNNSDDYGDFLDIDGGLLRITVIPDHKPHEHPVFGWEVADITATATAIKEKGVACTIYDGYGQDELGIMTMPDGDKMSFFADPDGNALTLSQLASR